MKLLFMYYNIISYCTWCVLPSMVLPGLALSPGPLSIAQHLLRKIEGLRTQLISFILTLQCPIVPSLTHQPSYVGRIVVERDGQVPRLRPRGGGSMNEDCGCTFVHRMCAIANFMQILTAILLMSRRSN